MQENRISVLLCLFILHVYISYGYLLKSDSFKGYITLYITPKVQFGLLSTNQVLISTSKAAEANYKFNGFT